MRPVWQSVCLIIICPLPVFVCWSDGLFVWKSECRSSDDWLVLSGVRTAGRGPEHTIIHIQLISVKSFSVCLYFSLFSYFFQRVTSSKLNKTEPMVPVNLDSKRSKHDHLFSRSLDYIQSGCFMTVYFEADLFCDLLAKKCCLLQKQWLKRHCFFETCGGNGWLACEWVLMRVYVKHIKFEGSLNPLMETFSLMTWHWNSVS